MNNLLKMEKFQLLHNRIYWGGVIGIFLTGLLFAETYLSEFMGPYSGTATSLTDIFNGMVYDSTVLIVLISSILAFLFSQEFSWRTINQEICAGHPRSLIFISKVIAYLTAFNFMAIVYPIAGCIREYTRFGIADLPWFLYNVGKAVAYSFFLNSSLFLIAIFFCCFLKNTPAAVAFTTIMNFVLSLYLGYGMMLKLPVSFLTIYQIREAVSTSDILLPYCFIVGIIWFGTFFFLSWRMFCKCDLK